MAEQYAAIRWYLGILTSNSLTYKFLTRLKYSASLTSRGCLLQSFCS